MRPRIAALLSMYDAPEFFAAAPFRRAGNGCDAKTHARGESKESNDARSAAAGAKARPSAVLHFCDFLATGSPSI